MPSHLHLDFETFSQADITDVGAYRYALDPSTEILCAAMALGEGEPVYWCQGMPQRGLDALAPYWDALEDPEVLIYAHNAQFEYAICQSLLWDTWGIQCPDISRFRCTMSLARRASLPGKLETLSTVLGLEEAKDKRGKALIKKFSMMQAAKKPTKKNPDGVPVRRIYPADEPEAFMDFVEYCRQDVRAEQEVARRLAYFDEPINNDNWVLHEKINARGVSVNLDALAHAQKLIEEETEIVGAKFRALTGFEHTQGKVLQEWLNVWHDFPNLQAETVDTFLEQYEGQDDVDDSVKALRMKQSIAYVSIKKVKTMLACAGPHDNRIRGMLNHHGATTGRSTNSLVQFQNMKRPSIYDYAGKGTSEEAYRAICDGISREMLELCYGPVLEVISSCVRHFVQDSGICDCGGFNCDVPIFGCTQGSEMLDADYAAIEARIVCWLAGQEDALEEYRAYDAAETKEEKNELDRYRIMAAAVYKIPLWEVEKFPHRFLGKEAILGCGFGMGPPKFRASCKKKGVDIELGMEFTAVKAFRSRHKKVEKYWYDVEECAKQAILSKGKVITLRNVAFQCRMIEGIEFLLIRLPSGRKLAYPRPKIIPSRFEGKTAIGFFGQLPKSVHWGTIDTYGGKLVENITQAVAADVMCTGAMNCERAGYQIMCLVHDQALAYYLKGQTGEEFVKLLTTLPAWAKGLPIEAEGGLVPFYKKD